MGNYTRTISLHINKLFEFNHFKRLCLRVTINIAFMWTLWCVERIFMTLDSYTMLSLSICESDLYRAKLKVANFKFYKSRCSIINYRKN